MSEAESIKQALERQFSFAAESVRIQREKRIWLKTSYDKFSVVFDFAVANLNFSMLCTITGLDLGSDFGMIYHLAREDGIALNIETGVPKENGKVKTISSYFPSGIIYEKEIVDLFGVNIEGIPEGVRYPLPDDWPPGQYPLRKDWNIGMLNQSSYGKGSANA